MTNSMRVLFLVSEADPLVKIGGLGDVGGSLPKTVHQLEGETIDIRLAIPLHGSINTRLHPIKPVTSFDVQHSNGPIRAEVYETKLNGVTVYLIGGEPVPLSAPVYSNDPGFDAHKYIFFSMAALELCRALNWQPDILHSNDWHTAAAIYALSRQKRHDSFFQKTAGLMAIHNLPYLGVGANLPLASFGLPPAYGSALPEWAIHMPLPLGLLSADHIVAVSPTYASEILKPEFGSGLHEFLSSRKEQTTGILNGIDYQHWNPASDSALAKNYTAETLSERAQNKSALLKEFHFSGPKSPDTALLAMIARMDYQKGVDLVVSALSILNDQPWQIIILGTGHFELEAAVRSLEQNLPQRVRAVIRFDPMLSRYIYAGADILLMPSRYEPCGLAQMIAMRYGCIPLARATGGLRDTIIDDPESKTSTGFLFKKTTPDSLIKTLIRALNTYQDKEHWQSMQLSAMQQDFSWERSAKEYISLYRKMKIS